MFNPHARSSRLRLILSFLAITFLSASLFLSSMASAQEAWLVDNSQVPGRYTWTNTTPNSLVAQQPRLTLHSQGSVVLDVYASFQCPHCQHFYSQERLLAARYGSRLTIRHYYVSLNEIALNEDLRLYLVAEDAGLGAKAADLLMRAGLDERDPKQMLWQTHEVAQQLGLSDAYEKALSDPSMISRIEALDQQASFVRATPTLVLNQQLQFDGDLENATTIIDGILR